MPRSSTYKKNVGQSFGKKGELRKKQSGNRNHPKPLSLPIRSPVKAWCVMGATGGFTSDPAPDLSGS